MADKTPRRKPGRPPMDPAERLRARITIRFRDDEVAALEAAAGDQPVSDWARAVLLRAAARKR